MNIMQVPNGFGSGLGAIQLILYAIYRDNKGEAKKLGSDESIEMGLAKPEVQHQLAARPDEEKQSNTQQLPINGHI